MSHHPRKRFGQNFLHDQGIIDQIIDTIRPQKDELLVEIGPGQAALTRPLLDSGCELHVIEIDRDLAAKLEKKLGRFENFHLHCSDALRTDFAELTGGRQCRLIGNLPYNISTPLMFHLFRWPRIITEMNFMLQKEVVDRLVATAGENNYGRLSVMAQFHASVSWLMDVAPEAFTPVPKVNSSIVRLKMHDQPPVEITQPGSLDMVVRQAFSMRRKTLRNALKPLLTVEQIEAAGVDPGARAETIDLEAFAHLANAIAG
jgi:16S rRNA (adenine1518-N6/adenine1519-N6)-dimethyltransferase